MMQAFREARQTQEPILLLPSYIVAGATYCVCTLLLVAGLFSTNVRQCLWASLALGLLIAQAGLLKRMVASKSMWHYAVAFGLGFGLFYVAFAVLGHDKSFGKFWNAVWAFIALGWMTYLRKKHQAIQHRYSSPMQNRNQSLGTSAQPERYLFPAKSARRTFDDIHGMDDLKARLKKAGTDITSPQLAQGTRVEDRNGILLFGGPGNGKTGLAEALAGTLGLPMITVTFGDVASKWINDTTENVVRVFRDAAAQAPCVLFLDEIDSLIKNRDMPSSSDESAKTTNAILTELVNLRGKGVVIVGATNYFDRLDAAAIREGRFDYKIEVSPPDENARLGILMDALNWNIPSLEAEFESVCSMSRRWEGFSVKRIQAVAEELAEMHAEKPLEKIDAEDLFAALRRVQGRKGKIPADTKSISALILPNKLRQQIKTIATRMRDIERVEKMGGTVPVGLLFFGEPGTGKTETARALAKESGWGFLSTSGNDLINDPRVIDTILAEAKDIRPCIVFIDEADDVLANRKASNVASITNKLLAAMDGAGGKVKDVVYIAATNHPDHLDPAAVRGGRFTEKLFFPLPDQDGIRIFVAEWMAKSPASFATDATPGTIAEELGDDMSIANAAAIMQEAVNQMIGSAVADSGEVTLHNIRGAKEVILGI
jgi:transitional endoplasmic reticulum ATPase